MGRTRPKTRKLKRVVTENTSEPPQAPSIPALLEKAQTLIAQCNYELAERFVGRILEREPRNAEAKEILGIVQLETGELDSAKQTFESLVPPNPDAPNPPPASAYLYLAQLSDEDPQQALQYYQSAVDLLTGQLKGKERAVDPAGINDDDAELKQNIVRALIAMVEIWMDPEYDLCFDPAVEKNCEDLLNLAQQIDPGNTEALQSLASVRMSQQRPEEAKQILEQAWVKWKDLELDDARLPSIPTRLGLVKLFLELELYEPALLVISGVMASDDQEVEAWYLEGWCFFMMTEQAREHDGTFNDVAWEQLAKDSRDCLDTCQMLHLNQDHPDKPILEHVNELIAKLEALGIHASPEGEDDGDEGGEWEDVEGSDDSDVEMS
ncbi:hypothetical protein NM688_g8771 [Phlebia brevispora]|uniref:Uncharacterized protein n=1 Tax=Phlebia brevispora TaxID=194682 RepID=A0ACC1RQ73_9APHY|nr:hypothetical protein NM688_g8771 [Phlebia brevispora]